MSRPELDPTQFRPNDWAQAERVIRRAEIRSDVRKWSRRVAPFLIVGAVLASGQWGVIPWPSRQEAPPAAATERAADKSWAAEDLRTAEDLRAAEESRTAAVPAEVPSAAAVSSPETSQQTAAAPSGARGTRRSGAVAPAAGKASPQAPATRPAAQSSSRSAELTGGSADAESSSLAPPVPLAGLLSPLQGVVPKGLRRQQPQLAGRFEGPEASGPAAAGPAWSPRLAISPLDASWSVGLERALAGGRWAPRSGLRVWGEAGWDRARMTATAQQDVGVFSYATVDRMASSRNALYAAAGGAVERALGNDVAAAFGVQAGYVLARKVSVRSLEPAAGVEPVAGWGRLEGVSRMFAGPVLRVHWDRWEHLRIGAELGYRMTLPETGSFASFETSGPVTARLIFSHRP